MQVLHVDTIKASALEVILVYWVVSHGVLTGGNPRSVERCGEIAQGSMFGFFCECLESLRI